MNRARFGFGPGARDHKRRSMGCKRDSVDRLCPQSTPNSAVTGLCFQLNETRLATPMKIATWNINGIKARHDGLLEWLRQSTPDIACLQEIKSVDENFPREEIEALGYHVETHGQKGFNGVALLSLKPPEEVNRGLVIPGGQAPGPVEVGRGILGIEVRALERGRQEPTAEVVLP